MAFNVLGLLLCFALSSSFAHLVVFNNPSCLIGHLNAQFNIPFTKKDGSEGVASYSIENYQSAQVECKSWDTQATLSILFGNDSLELIFWRHLWPLPPLSKNGWLNDMSYRFTMDPTRFPHANLSGTERVVKLEKPTEDSWDFPRHKVWLCDLGTRVNLSQQVFIEFTDVHLRPFPQKPDGAVHCKADDAKKGSFVYSDKKTIYAKLKTSATISVQYNIKTARNTTESKKASATLDPNNVAVSGSHENDMVQMNISYPGPYQSKSESPLHWALTFKKKDGNILVTESILTFGIDDQSPFQFDMRAVDKDTMATVKFDTSGVKWAKNLSWECDSQQTAKGVVSSNQTDLKVSMSAKDTQLAAFNHPFSQKAERCHADLKPGNWSVYDDNHTACIKLEANITLDVYYYNTSKQLAGPVKVLVPNNATANGSCNDTWDGDQRMSLTWKKDKKYKWELSLWFSNLQVFTTKPDGDAYTDYRVQLKAHIKGDKDFQSHQPKMDILSCTNEVNRTTGNGALSVMGASKDHSIKCSQYDVTIKPDKDILLKVTIKNVLAQAFVYNNDFQTSETCKRDQKESTSTLIPIVVGACLAALVVLVLVAYLVGRARAWAPREGYESV